ncbi:hypothetical protein SAMN05216480_112117 [Pustulibacterium marinum]|uniref:Uncharacterized protein n=1 Tax=Pustulibacterium marinum TaxID=1224947 RepID=A0A1I7I2Z9_9FLAO|nr:hypothetical protein [Pustulibacterium marinum]SFU67295.1 hypothetical protein SAMN05216480_112117 [Pustulibacterium marinum]
MTLGIVGPLQLILLSVLGLAVPVGIFLLGFYAGKKAGYQQRVEETEAALES